MVRVLFHFFNFVSYKLRMFGIIDENQAFSKSSCIAENLVVISLTVISYHHAKTSLWIWCCHLLHCIVSLNDPNCSDVKGVALVLLHAFKLCKLLKQLSKYDLSMLKAASAIWVKVVRIKAECLLICTPSFCLKNENNLDIFVIVVSVNIRQQAWWDCGHKIMQSSISNSGAGLCTYFIYTVTVLYCKPKT